MNEGQRKKNDSARERGLRSWISSWYESKRNVVELSTVVRSNVALHFSLRPPAGSGRAHEGLMFTAAASCSSHQVTRAVAAANAPRRPSSSTARNTRRHQLVTATSRCSASATADTAMSSSPTIAPFEFTTAARTLFGVGTSKKVPALVKELTVLEGCADRPVLIVAGASDRFSKPLVEALAADGIASVVYNCPGGEPTTGTAEAAIALAASNKCGAVIAIGGGTPVDTGKCVAAVLTNGGDEPDLYDFLEVVGRAQPLTKRCAPFIAIPTTAGPGAEVGASCALVPAVYMYHVCMSQHEHLARHNVERS